MALRTNRLYLIEIGYHTVAIIPSRGSSDAISKYLTRIGFEKIYAYFCSCLMTNTIKIKPRAIISSKCYFITAKTIGGSILSISSQQAVSCDDIFSLVSLKDINDRLLMKPTIDEVRNCVGFGREPMYKLRKFCI